MLRPARPEDQQLGRPAVSDGQGRLVVVSAPQLLIHAARSAATSTCNHILLPGTCQPLGFTRLAHLTSLPCHAQSQAIQHEHSAMRLEALADLPNMAVWAPPGTDPIQHVSVHAAAAASGPAVVPAPHPSMAPAAAPVAAATAKATAASALGHLPTMSLAPLAQLTQLTALRRLGELSGMAGPEPPPWEEDPAAWPSLAEVRQLRGQGGRH